MGGNKSTIFQAVVLGIFGLCIAGGLILFATFVSSSKEKQLSNVVMWGTLDRDTLESYIGSETNNDSRFQNISYIQKDQNTFDSDLADALASGTGPDLILLRQDSILKEKNKILTIPFSSLSKKAYSDTYSDEGNLYLVPDGILALPVVVDPLVLYWNKDFLAKDGYAQPPQYWDEVFDMAEKMKTEDAAGGITKSAIALGESANISNMKGIVSMLIMQAGGSITGIDSNGKITSLLSNNPNYATELPAVSALRFYTSFANPTESVYSWNRSLPSARDAFAQGIVALYVGYASEMTAITALNPNLKFDVAPVPQIRNTQRSVTFGNMYALAISRTTLHPTDALTIASFLSSAKIARELSTALHMPPVRRDLLSQSVDGPNVVFSQAALIASAWLDPDTAKSDAIFKAMIAGVTSGSARLTEAVDKAGQALQVLLK